MPAVAVHVRAWLSLQPLFSTYSLLVAYLLATYTYKRIHLLIRVYGMQVWMNHLWLSCVSKNEALHQTTRAIHLVQLD